ncbi:MAG TPA: hypothetical protein VFU71_21635 [Burkholderiaceae bacterium]|nr:hypothetical protein [Burkholderiaceae bacterium]
MAANMSNAERPGAGGTGSGESIGRGFCLVMELEDPVRLAELMAKLDSPEVKPRIQKALASLDYIHYARFVPLWDRGLLLIVTEFDGAMADYVLDFAAVLDDEFSLILSYMKDHPPLPVSRYPEQFWAYVDKYTGPKKPRPDAYPEPFSAYAGLTALEIAGTLRDKALPAPKPPVQEPAVDLSDVQAHTMRPYKATLAWHFGFQFNSTADGQKVLSGLRQCLSHAALAPREQKLCITLGLTHAGLQALGLPQATLDAFPTAFREGPQLRSERLGDIGRSAPSQWKVPAKDTQGQRRPVHGMVSVYTNADKATLDRGKGQVRECTNGRVSESFTCDAEAIGTQGEIHFGYRDGIGQPRFAAVEAKGVKSDRPLTPTGDLLLGPRYRNSRGGYYIGALPPVLALNGTYAALRVISQDVEAFEQFLRGAAQQYEIDPELVAAKLVGRWRNGTPLSYYPEKQNSQAGSLDSEALDGFGYTAREYGAAWQKLQATQVQPSTLIGDRDGRRCPFGAHIRRLNPRDGMVLGVPWGRRIVRRGMPYTVREKGQVTDRGLIGMFLCGDLESQFEFIQHVWANQGLSAPGLRHTQDPFSSAVQTGTPLRFRTRESEAEVTVMVPPLTTTIGSAYLFVPGLNAVDWLAAGRYHTE